MRSGGGLERFPDQLILRLLEQIFIVFFNFYSEARHLCAKLDIPI